MSGRSRREWGWHPLTADWARRIVEEAAPGAGHLVLDIGAGTGALTRPLLATGARVVAVEPHRGRAEALERRVGDRSRLTVVRADALQMPWPRRTFRVVASPPYGISTALVRRLVEAEGLRSAHLVVQRGFAQRVARGGLPGLRRFEASIARPLPRHAFAPPPRVDSALLVLRRHRPTRARPARR